MGTAIEWGSIFHTVWTPRKVSAGLDNDNARELIEGPIESVDLALCNVDRRERVTAVAQ